MAVGVVDGEERFDGFVQPHPHFVCDVCGKVVDLPFSVIEPLDSAGKNDKNIYIDYKKTVFHGTCGSCSG